MKFTHAIAYCRGFYKSRGEINETWKDLSHCIQSDGYMCFTKKSVADWCLSQIDKFAKEFPNEAYKVSFTSLYRKIQHNKNIWEMSGQKSLDDIDYLLWAFIDFISYDVELDHFTGGTVPDAEVLPLSDGISENLWNIIVSKFKTFKKCSTFETYEQREANIVNYN